MLEKIAELTGAHPCIDTVHDQYGLPYSARSFGRDGFESCDAITGIAHVAPCREHAVGDHLVRLRPNLFLRDLPGISSVNSVSDSSGPTFRSTARIVMAGTVMSLLRRFS